MDERAFKGSEASVRARKPTNAFYFTQNKIIKQRHEKKKQFFHLFDFRGFLRASRSSMSFPLIHTDETVSR
jgi:hypothetical protein